MSIPGITPSPQLSGRRGGGLGRKGEVVQVKSRVALRVGFKELRIRAGSKREEDVEVLKGHCPMETGLTQDMLAQ